MPSRFAPLLAALLLFLSSGFSQGASYLCRMDGQVHKTCCCKSEPTTNPTRAEEHKFERDHRCCEVQASSTASAPATLSGASLSPQLIQVRALLSESAPLQVIADARPRGREGSLERAARAPPRPPRLPLFVQHCRFLI